MSGLSFAKHETLPYAIGMATLALAAWSFVESHPLLVATGTAGTAGLLWYFGKTNDSIERGKKVADLLSSTRIAPVHLLFLSVIGNGLLMHTKSNSTTGVTLLSLATLSLYAHTCDA